MTNKATETDEMLTIKEAAGIAGMSPRHFCRLIAAGVIPAWKPTPGIVRISKRELLRRIYADMGITPEEGH